VAFVHDVIDWSDDEAPTAYQDEILDSTAANTRLAVRGPHGLGKTAIAAWLILHMWATRDDVFGWKAPTTAGAWRQVSKYLWPEVHQWARRLRPGLDGWERLWGPSLVDGRNLLDLSIKGRTGEAFGVACKDPATLEGAHADEILYVYDEAKIIPTTVFDATEGAFSAGRARAFAFSTPGAPAGRFYDICARKPGYDEWSVRHVTADEVLDAGRMSRGWFEAKRSQWGEESPRFQNRCLGEFAASSEEATIPLAWVEQAIERWWDFRIAEEAALAAGDRAAAEAVWGELTHQGVDVADGGDDDTVIARRYGRAIRDLHIYPTGDTMQTAARAMAFANPWPGALTVVDGIGVGSGVVARMKEQRVRVEAFIGSQGADNLKDRSDEWGFYNLRSAAWWLMREALEPPSDVALPPDERLTGDLTMPKWREMSDKRGVIKIESKDEMARRMASEGLPYRSPDCGDAAVMAFFADHLRSPGRTNVAALTSRRL
jgi:hypothetical protein